MEPSTYQIAFLRFGISLSEEEVLPFASFPVREAVTHLLASREITARFDAAHGRVPCEMDIDLLVDMLSSLD